MKVDAWESFRVLIGVWCKQFLTGRLIAPNRYFSYKLSLYHSIKRATASVYNCSCSVCNESKTKNLHRVFLWSKALVFVHWDRCTNVTLGWITTLHVERRLWFSITLNRKKRNHERHLGVSTVWYFVIEVDQTSFAFQIATEIKLFRDGPKIRKTT